MIVPIQQTILTNFPTVKQATFANVTDIVVRPDAGASGHIVLGNLEEDGRFTPAHDGFYTVALTPEQFDAWGEDDNYAVSCLIDNIGIYQG